MRKIVVGGGAAGLMCAGFAVAEGKEAVVLERNAKPARKVLITGKGRCNVTNHCTPDELIQNVRTNPRFLFGAIHGFSPTDAMALFEELGVPLKTERGRRVFPVSDKAADIAEAMVRFATENGGRIMTGKRADRILTEEGRVTGVHCTDGDTLACDAAVIATGGRSYPRTGSDGDGYRLAAALGHTIIPQRPSLVSIRAAEPWCADAAGLSLKNVTLTVKMGKRTAFQELGEMLFTHTGVSGPLVLSASSYMEKDPGLYRLLIDLKPALTAEKLDARVLRDFAEYRNRDFGNALDMLLPRTLIPVVAALSGIPGDTKVHSVTKEQRCALVSLMKALPLTPVGFGPLEEAVITAGGVCVKEIDPKTMESKLVKGLFFAGEVIDVDAFTGGYNLQIAYSTAYAAAKAL